MRRIITSHWAWLCLAIPLAAQVPNPLTLAEASRLALANNPRMPAAQMRAAAAYREPARYKANYAPSVSGALSAVGADDGSRLAAGGINNPVVYSRVGSGLAINQLITDFGRTSNLVGAAQLQARAQDEVTSEVRAGVLLAVARAYFGLLRAQSVMKVADQTVAARQLAVDQVSALAQAKMKSSLDVSFAGVNLADAKLLQAQAQNDASAAQAQLAEAMGLPAASGFVLTDEPMPPPMADHVDALIAGAMRDRPELKQLQLRESAAERFVKAEHSLYYPSVGIVGTAGFVPGAFANVPGRYGAAGLNVSIPVFNGGLFKARQTEAELNARAVRSDSFAAANQIARDVRVAWLNAETANDRMALARQYLDEARQAVDLAQSRYDLGLGSIVELSQAQLNLTSAQIASATARYDYQTARMLLDFQTGALR